MKCNKMFVLLLLCAMWVFVACDNAPNESDNSVYQTEQTIEINEVNQNEDYEIASQEEIKEETIFDRFKIIRFLDNISSSGEILVEAAHIYENGVVDEDYCTLVLDENFDLVLEYIENKGVLLDNTGNNITDKYIDEANGEELMAVCGGDKEITIWTMQETDTYDKHTTTIYAKNIEGNIMQSWNSDEFDLGFGAIYAIYHLEKGVYVFDQDVININTGNGFSYPPSGNEYVPISVDENGGIYTKHNIGVGWTFDKANDLGKGWSVTLYGNAKIGQYSEGLIFIKDSTNVGFIDTEAKIAIDLSVLGLDITNEPKFNGGYALVECQNEAEVKFITLIDKKGNMLFEPIRGTSSSVEYVDSLGYYVIMVDDQIFKLNIDGTLTEASQLLSFLYDYFSYKYYNEKYYVLEDGKIVVYDIE